MPGFLTGEGLMPVKVKEELFSDIGITFSIDSNLDAIFVMTFMPLSCDNSISETSLVKTVSLQTVPFK